MTVYLPPGISYNTSPSQCVSEIRMEICLPPSGLAKINYPDEFPTPPSGSPTRVDDSVRDRAAGHGLENDPSMLTAELEKSWGYYLSDIAVRRIANRVMNTFYRGSPSSWLSMPLERMIRMAEELELQLTQWYSLPRSASHSRPRHLYSLFVCT